MSGFYGHHELVGEPATPVHYGVEEGQEGFGEEDYDPNTSSPDIGSNAEVGGVDVDTNTNELPNVGTGSSTLLESNDVNLTGMSESPMTPVTEGNGANVNGSGQAGQQVSTRPAAESWISQTYESVIKGINRQGTTTTTIAQAGASQSPVASGPSNPVTLTQTGVNGISLHGNLVLFAVLGIVVGLVVFGDF